MKGVRKIYNIDYYASVSGLKDVSPGLKGGLAAGTLFICLLANRWEISFLIFVSMAGLSILAGKISPGNYGALLKIPLSFLILGTAALVIGFSPVPYGSYYLPVGKGCLYLTREGLFLAFGLVLKALACLGTMYMLVLSTPASQLIRTLRAIGIPKMLLELMTMIYRFIFIITATHAEMKQAARSRLGYWGFGASCRSFGNTAANLFFISLKKAGACYDALTARCYEGELLFLEEENKAKGWQVGAVLGYLFALFLLWRFFAVY